MIFARSVQNIIQLSTQGTGSSLVGSPAGTIRGTATTADVASNFVWALRAGITSAKARLIVGGTPETATDLTGSSGTVSLTPLNAGTYKAQLLDSSASIVLWETTGFTVSAAPLPVGLFSLNFSDNTYTAPDGSTSADPVEAGLMSVARSTGGYAEHSDGTWEWFEADTPRITDKGLLSERPAFNPINSAWDGAVPSADAPVGANKGTLPRGLTLGLPSGLYWQVVDFGTPDTNTGLPRLRLRIAGTTSGGSAEWRFNVAGGNAGASAGSWLVAPTDYIMGTMFLGLVSGTLPTAGAKLGFTLLNGNGPSFGVSDEVYYPGWMGTLTTDISGDPAQAPSTSKRIETLPILCAGSDGSTGTPRLGLTWTFASASYDFVLDLVAPQIEKLPFFAAEPTSPIIGRSIVTAATGTSGTTVANVVTVASVANLSVGQTVAGSGIAAYTAVTAINSTTREVTLSTNLTTSLSNANLTFYGARRDADTLEMAGGLLASAQSSTATIKAKLGARRWRYSTAAAQRKGLFPVNPMNLPILGYNAGTKLLQRESDGGVGTALGYGASTFRAWLGNWTLGAKEATVTWGGGSIGLASEAGADYTTASGAAPSITSVQIGTVDGTAYLDGYLTELSVANAHTADLTPVANVAGDIGIYGAKFAGVTTAVRAKKEGKNPVLIGDWREYTIGGMSSNGLGSTDIITVAAYGGLSKSMYVRAAAKRGSLSDTSVVNEPRLFRAVLEDMICENGIPVYWTGGAASALKDPTSKRASKLFTRSRSVSGKYCAPKVFTCSAWSAADYEGDMLPVLGISNHRAREANTEYNETRGGWDMVQTGTDGEQSVNGGNERRPRLGTSHVHVDPWNIPYDSGNPASGPASGLITGLSEHVRVIDTLEGTTGDFNGQYAILTNGVRKVYRWTGSSWVLPEFGDADLINMQAYAYRLTMLRKRSYTESPPSAQTTASSTATPNQITVAAAAGIVPSTATNTYYVVGAGIPADTSVIAVAGTTITLSANATGLSATPIKVYSSTLSNGSNSRFQPIFPEGAETDPGSFGFTPAKVEGFIRLLEAVDAKAVEQGRTWAVGAYAVDISAALSAQANSGQKVLTFATLPVDGSGNTLKVGYRVMINGAYMIVQSVSAGTVTLTENLPINLTSGTSLMFISPTWGLDDLFAMKPGQDGFNLVTDVNFMTPFSNDYIGGAITYPDGLPVNYLDASPEDREVIVQNHTKYVQNLWWAMQYHADSRITGSANLSAMRAEALIWGWDKWHYTDNLSIDPVGIPPQLYVREGRRMINADLANYSGYVPVCYTLSVGAPINSTTLTFASTAGILEDMNVYHNNTTSRIPAGTTVLEVTANTVTISAATTGSIATGLPGGGISFLGAGGVVNANPVWTEQDVLMPDGSMPRDPRTVAVISYPMDSHPYINVPIWTGEEWSVWPEGEVYITTSALTSNRGYPMGANRMGALPAGALLPAADECTNFMSTFAVAASKMCFGPFRMEATSAVSGEAAGLWLTMAVDEDINAQEVEYGDDATPGTFRHRYLTTDTGARNSAGLFIPPIAPLNN